MDQDILGKIGLNNAEVKVYETLIKIGTSTTGKIVKESNIPSSHIYEILNNLINKGLVDYHISKNKKYFEATNPENLLRIYEEKKNEVINNEKNIKDKINELIKLSTINEETTNVKIYESNQGIKTSISKMLEVLKKGETYYVLGAPIIGNKKLNAFYKEIHEQRIKKGIKFKIIYNASAKKFAEERKKNPLTEVRVLNIDTPTEFCIFQNYVQIILFSKPLILEIRDQGTAKSFTEYFEILWSQAKE